MRHAGGACIVALLFSGRLADKYFGLEIGIQQAGRHAKRRVQRQAGKDLGQEAGIMAGCQTKRQTGIEAEMHRGRRRY